MTKELPPALDENTRRYYLDVMGVQCWQSIETSQQSEQVSIAATVDHVSLEESIQRCTSCSLHETRKQALPGRGNPSAELMFVLLAPDESDDASGNICSGEADVLLGKMLAAIGINIEEVYLSSLLKCKVPIKHTVSPKEIQSCNDYLLQQIQQIQPKLLVILGETAVCCLLQEELSIDDARAKINDKTSTLYNQVPLYVSYSPEELLQQPENKRKAWADLQQLQKIIDS